MCLLTKTALKGGMVGSDGGSSQPSTPSDLILSLPGVEAHISNAHSSAASSSGCI